MGILVQIALISLKTNSTTVVPGRWPGGQASSRVGWGTIPFPTSYEIELYRRPLSGPYRLIPTRAESTHSVGHSLLLPMRALHR